MDCAACGSPNRNEARFCAACGSALSAVCPECGTEVPPGARFCDGCGAKLAEEPAAGDAAQELRKTVTVVFADLVGSTSLQEHLDAESVRRVMARFYEAACGAIDEYDGQVVKLTGDGVMAAFGTPVVQEDDALRAVRAAYALVGAVGELNEELEREWGVRLQLRTGVNTGEVVVPREGGDLIGDPVNVAARLEQAAGEGEVLVGEETRRLVRHDVSLESLEPLPLKGKSERVAAFRLVAAVPAPGEEARIEAPLVGRDAELGRLRAAFDAAVADSACRLVTVIGSPGIGKTRLAQELAGAVEHEATVLEGRCEPSDEGITFAPVAEVLRTAAGIDEADATEAAREKLTGLLPDAPDRELVVERALGVLGAVHAASTEETFWAVRRVLEMLARERPLVVVLDDLHWGQPTFLDLVEHLVEWARDVPLLLVGLARPELRELREALVSGRRAADVIELDPLDAAESRTLVDELLGQADLPVVLAERVLHATEGNPLFVGETVRMLVDEGVLRRQDDTWVVSSESVDVEVPPTIHALIAARLERLGDDERSVVERASVIGKQFYRGAVAQLSPPPVRRGIDGHLETLRRKELVEPEGTYWIDEPVFRFHHVLIRDEAYRSLLKEARAELHERFADWLESKAGDLIGEHEEVVAFHLEQSHEYRSQLGPLDERGRALGQRAAERLASAGRRALAREDLPAAANLLGRALDRLDEDAPARPGLLADLAEARLSAGDTHAAAAAVEALRAACGAEPRLRALATVYVGQLTYLTDSSRLHETVDSVAAAAEELAALGDEAGVAKARHVQAGAFARLGQVAACEAALDRALAAARSAGDSRRVSAVLSGAPLAALWGPSPVVRASGRCLDVVRILRMTPGNRHLEAAALSCQAVLEAMRGRADAARSMLDGCRATFEELGLGFELLETEVHAGIVELLDGDAVAAEVRLRSAYEGFAALGAGARTAVAAALLARTLLDQGRDDEADELTRTSEERAGEDLKATIAWCGVRAGALARRGEHAAAEELARRGAAMAEPTDALTDHADARMALAAVLQEAGREGDAVEEARRALELYEAKENEAGARRAAAFAGVEVPTGVRSDARAELRGPAPPAVWERLLEQIAAAQSSHDPGEVAALLTEDVTFVNHRRIATWDQVRGAAAFLELQEALWAGAPDIRYSVLEFVEGDDLVSVSRWALSGRLEAGGGDATLALVATVRRRGDRVDRVEFFDEDDEAGARACAERLRAEVAGESANARLARRFVDTFHARDWDAWRACFAEDLLVIDHRVATPLGRERDLETYVAQIRALVDQASDVRIDYELVADVDEVSAARAHWRGHLNEGGGEFETPLVLVTRRRGDRVDRIEVLDPDDDAAWAARFAELLGERGAAAAAGARATACYHARDWAGFRSVYADDARLLDHRQVGLGEVHGAEQIVDFVRGLVDLAPDIHLNLVRLLDLAPDVYLGRHDMRGHAAEGGEVEVPYLYLLREGNGLIDRVEIFDPGDEDAARRRFRELAGAAEESAGARLSRRFADTLNARDWEGWRACLTDDLVVVDHRVATPLGRERDVEAFEAQCRALVNQASDVRFAYELVADVGDVGAARAHWRGHLNEGGGEFETPYVLVVRRRGDRFDRIEVFDPDDDPVFCARVAELLGPRGRAVAVCARWLECYHARDWDGVRATFSDDAIVADRRRGVGAFRGPESNLEFTRGLVELAPDVRFHLIRVLGVAPSVCLVRADLRGHAADGGAIEVPYLLLNRVRDGVFDRAETFDPGDEELARRRFVELASPVEASPNARLFRRYVDALNARDWETADACLGEELQVLDHRVLSLLGRQRDRETHHAQVRALVDQASDVQAFYEVVADLDRLFVARGGWHGHLNEGGGWFETPFVLLARRSGDRVDRLEAFESDDDAGLCARLGELLGQRGGALATWARWTERYHARDWDGLKALCADDIAHVDRRPVGFGQLHGVAALMDWTRGLIELAPDTRLHLIRVLDASPDLGLIRFDVRGHTADGGELEVPWILLACLRDGLIQRNEMFDPADEDEARRRFEELAGADGLSPNERLGWRFTDAVNARDWDAAAACVTDDWVIVDHRSVSPIGPAERDWGTFLEQQQALVGVAGDVRASFEVVADVDEVIACRFAWRGHYDEGGGEFEIAVGLVGRRRGDRVERHEGFDPDDTAGLFGRFGELLGDRGAAIAAGVRWMELWNAREWERADGVLADDVLLEDLRPGIGGTARGRDELVARQMSTVASAPDARITLDRVLGAHERAAVTAWSISGHIAEGGGEFLLDYLQVVRHEAGSVTHAWTFEPCDEAAAFARFEELSRAPATPRELFERFATAYNMRDWDVMREVFAPDVRFVDRRLVGSWGEGEGLDAYLDILKSGIALAPDLQSDFEPLALSHAAVAFRYLARGHLAAGGGEFEIDAAAFGLLEDGRVTYFEMLDDADAAFARFEEIGAQTQPERLIARMYRLANARDWDALGDCFTEAFEGIDRRVLGWETTRGRAAQTEIFRSGIGVAPDGRWSFETLGGDDEHIALRWTFRGHAADGGGLAELVGLSVVTYRAGRFARAERFDDGEAAAALARLEELQRGPAGPRELAERFVAAYNRRDRDAMRDVLAPDMRVVDRRLVGWGELDGREAFLDVATGAFPLAPDIRMDLDAVWSGRSAFVFRYVARGHLEAGGGEVELGATVFNLFEDGRVTYSEFFDSTDTDAALARFEEIGAPTEPERLYARVCRSVNARDWDAVRGCYAEDLQVVDHRTLGWEDLRGPNAMIELFRSWIEVAPDAELWFEALDGDDLHMALRIGGHGHAAAGGGAFQYVATLVAVVRDGRIAYGEHFGADEDDAALARLEELRGVPDGH